MKTKYIIILLYCLVLASCKDKSEKFARLSVRMHDMPINADSVFVEILEVRVHSDEEGWITLNTEAGIYDLLQLQNGVDTLLVPPQQIGTGHISQIRFILGDENTLVIDDVTFPLALSSQDESGLKLNLHADIVEDQDYVITVDFDAEESIILQGNGTYKLKPVLRAEIQ